MRGIVGTGSGRITIYTEVMHLVASNQARILKSFAQQTGTNRTGGRTDNPCNLAKTCPLFSQPCHLVAIDYPTRAAQRLPFEYRVAQPGPNSLLNE
jgi:hypothetical protein